MAACMVYWEVEGELAVTKLQQKLVKTAVHSGDLWHSPYLGNSVQAVLGVDE